MGTGSGYRGDTYISRRVNLSTAMEFCGYDSNLCSCGAGVPLEQPKTGYESQDRCGSGRLLSYQGC